MVSVGMDKKTGRGEISPLRIQRHAARLEQEFAERERNNRRLVTVENVPTGDPPTIMLWGEE